MMAPFGAPWYAQGPRWLTGTSKMALLDDRSVQRALAAQGLYKGEIDGVIGTVSAAGFRTWATTKLADFPKSVTSAWPLERQRIAFEQSILAELGFYKAKIDGLAGPASQAAVEKWQDYVTFKRKPLPAKEVAYQKTIWPRQSELRKFYGVPGENLTRLVSPYPLYLDWALSTKVSSFMCHEKIHDAAERVMKRVLDHYGLAEIHRLGLDQFGGCYSNRLMRNGRTLSTHAWAIAIDWDADRNPLRATRGTALMATPPYAKFLDLWEEEGFVSLGRARNFDWMHVQAARL